MDSKEIERRMKFLLQENRLATFKTWGFGNEDNCSALKMAEAGFYFIGDKKEPDVVQCFLCEKTLDGWESTDDPWLEHSKHSPNCHFAQQMCAEDALTLYRFLDIKGELLKSICKKISDAVEENLRAQYAEERKYALKYLK